PGFLIARHPVTNAAYEAFLSALLRAGRDDLAKFAAPAGWTSPAGAIARPASEDPQSPVRGITFDAATAFAAYTAKRSGRPWRLPREREWERAARGVDERMFPWGNFLDPAWSCVAASHGGSAPQPASIAAFPLDVSPWGVRGMGGNVRDWCIGDSAPRQGRVRPEHHWVRGGHHLGIAQLARPALRYQLATHHHPGVGLRLVCALDD
ncbi:MAG: formylglycine-generating enzyme family protein, partial [Myxococcales bacterium]|nr:formylglycine-generating enzyme family protein [Myxococcales bacterium]